jgi:prevent-host-death family protein
MANVSYSPRVRTVNATRAKNAFGEMLRDAYQSEQHVIIEKTGMAVAVLVPIADYERMMRALSGDTSHVAAASRTQTAQANLRAVLVASHAQMPDVDGSEAERDIRAAVSETRRAKRTASYKSRRPAHRKA